jgi:hypothetical protein
MIQRLGLSLDISDSEDTEANFLDVIWSKVLRVFSPFFERKWFETACNVSIVYGNLKSENSQDYGQKPEFGFWK